MTPRGAAFGGQGPEKNTQLGQNAGRPQANPRKASALL